MYLVPVKDGPQRTIKEPIRLDGVGLHTGYPVSAVIEPAPVDTGILVVHLESGKEIPALSDYVVDTRFATVLGDGNGAKVSTVEHFLATLYAMDIDNALIKVFGPEVPILDGSARPIVEMIVGAGVRKQESPRYVYSYEGEPLTVSFDESSITIEPGDGFLLELTIEFPGTIIGTQEILVEVNPRTFLEEISPARTFTLKSEIDWLWAHNLALGGSLDNAIVVDEDRVLNEGGLRFPDEFVRHKVLDFIGDLSLLGVKLRGKIRAHRPGHTVNSLFTQELKSLLNGSVKVQTS